MENNCFTANFHKYFLGAELPDAYRKFWNEWHHQLPAAVHYVPKEGKFERDPKTGLVTPIQNVPIPLKRVREEWNGIWGGEAVVQGYRKKKVRKCPMPHFWVPTLKRSVVRSEVLNEYMSVVVTERTIRMIHEHHGFDHYLLKSPACDLRSILALKIKQKILKDLLEGSPAWQHDPSRQQEINKEFNKYLDQYTNEEIDWYGLTWMEAIRKRSSEIKALNPILPHKVIFRAKLIEQLKAAGIEEAQEFEIESSK